MFWKKKAEPQSPAQSPRRGMSMDSPRPQPILKTAPDQGGGPSIRFAGSGPTGGHPRSQSHPASFSSPKPAPQQSQWTSTPPTAEYGQRPPLAVLTSSSTATNPAIQRLQGPRRSSRPASPSSTSFGARLPQAPRSAPLSTPPMISPAHVTTPPTAYASSMTSRAPPPPSPYRPTSERRLTPDNLASRPPRISSLFETPSAPGRFGVNLSERTPTGRDEDLPTFNFIPATPQAMGEEWGVKRSVSGSALEKAFPMEDMVDVPLETSSCAPVIKGGMETISESIPTLDSLPAIANLEFSPFEMTVSLPSVESGSSISSLPYSLDSRSSLSDSAPLSTVPQLPPNEPLPSPPFDSYPSLPSLDSEPSLRSSTSQSSLPSSSSISSLASYSDVEEALGSMLASLSDPAMPLSQNRTDRVGKSTSNPGLGLGLSLPPSASITAPLSPRRKGPPPPLDLANTSREAAGPDQQSAPARINHRVAFYTTARAAPNSPSSGIFINGANGQTEFIVASPTRSESGNSISSDDTQLPTAKDVNGWRDSIRSSISFGSEASDDDPYTASIVCLMPVKGGVAAVHRDEYLAEETEVGLAL